MHKTIDCQYGRQSGFSLVELMVALALGMIIAVIVSSVYVGQRVSSTLGKEASLLQEEGSRAIDAMARDLRQAGDFNCANTPATNGVETNVVQMASGVVSKILNSDSSLYLNMDTPGIRGFSSFNDVNGSALPGAAAIKTALENIPTNNAAQVVAVTGTFDSQSPLLSGVVPTGSSVKVNHQDFAAGQIVVLSDCVNASVLRVNSYTRDAGASATQGTLAFMPFEGKPGTVGGAAATVGYKVTTSVARLATAWWFFGTPKFGSDVWPTGLYRVDGDVANATNGSGFKLISAQMNNMSFSFDVDNGRPGLVDPTKPDGVVDTRGLTAAGVINALVPATLADKWKVVRNVRVELLLKSTKDVFPEAQTYYFNGASAVATDKKMYLPLELTTTLRNMNY